MNERFTKEEIFRHIENHIQQRINDIMDKNKISNEPLHRNYLTGRNDELIDFSYMISNLRSVNNV